MPTGAENPPGAGARPPGPARALIDSYARRLPARLDELGEELADLAGAPDDPEARARVHRKAHQVRGTAGSFGFPRVSEEVGRIDDILRRAGAREPLDVSALTAALESARELARAGARGGAAEVSAWKARLVYLDPDAGARERVQEIGRRLLIEVLPAAGVREAADHLAREEVDGAIADLPRGGADAARALARELRAVPGHSELPLAFASMDEATGIRVRAANAGASLFLAKPIPSGALDDAARHLAAIRRHHPPRALILDDDDTFAALAARALGEGGVRARAIAAPRDLLGLMESLDPEAVLLGPRAAGGASGLDLCRMLRTTSRFQDVPLLSVTDDPSPETRVSAYAAGADDVLLKPVRPDELRLRVILRVDRRRLVRAQLERDPLTDLPLRRWFVDRLRARLSEAHRRGQPVALALLDLDHFKTLNDRHGHLAGDRALAHLGHLLAARFRGEDLRARWGGEEFILAFPGERAVTAAALATSLLGELARAPATAEDGGRLPVSFSAGVAEFPRDGDAMETLLRAADRRLYAAKAGGRGRVRHAD